MPPDDPGHGHRVDIAEIIVDEDIAKPADLAPRHIAISLLEIVRQQPRRLGQGLQVAQRRVVQNVVARQIAPRLDAADLRD